MDPDATLRTLLDAVGTGDAETAAEMARALHELLNRRGFSFVVEAESGHQGWKNYETWAVHLWLTNDQPTDRHCCLLTCHATRAASECSQVADGIWTVGQARRFLLVDALKEFVASRNPLAASASVYADLLGSALDDVDWYEVAEAFLERAMP